MLKRMTRRDKAIAVLDEVSRAEARARSVIHSAYPVGAELTWQRGGHIQHGTIANHSDHGSGRRFRVRNSITGKAYWIDFYDVRGPQC